MRHALGQRHGQSGLSLCACLQDIVSPFAGAQEPRRTIPAFGGPRESDDGAAPSGPSPTVLVHSPEWTV